MVMAGAAGDARGSSNCDPKAMRGGHALATELFDCYLESYFECRHTDLQQRVETEPWANNSRYTGDEFQTVMPHAPRGDV
jgi:hypothetical protein